MRQLKIPAIYLGISCLIYGAFLWGFHEGDKHALDTMRLIGCQNSDVESFQMQEIPPEKGDPL